MDITHNPKGSVRWVSLSSCFYRWRSWFSKVADNRLQVTAVHVELFTGRLGPLTALHLLPRYPSIHSPTTFAQDTLGLTENVGCPNRWLPPVSWSFKPTLHSLPEPPLWSTQPWVTTSDTITLEATPRLGPGARASRCHLPASTNPPAPPTPQPL